MYHKIDPRNEVGINTLSPETFQRQMTFLAKAGYQTITFHHFLTTAPLPRRPVIITFDDAYESVYENAFPIMQQYEFTGVVYVIGKFIGRKNRWDANFGGLTFRHANVDQLRTLDEAGWELGAHSMTHRALSWLKKPALEAEIYRSKSALENIASRPTISFAYPFGMHNRKARQAVKSAGFHFGCGGVRASAGTDLMAIERIPVYQFEGISAFKRKLFSGPQQILEKWKLSLLSSPAVLTPIYQYFFKQELFLDDAI